MPPNSVYLVIHSQSLLTNPKDKPCFRVVTELSNLHARFTSHDHGNHKYTDVRVITSGTRLGEEWEVELEHDVQQDIEIVGWCNTLEAAAEKLTNSLLDNNNAHEQRTAEENGDKQKVRVTLETSLDGNLTAFCRIKSTQTNFDGSTSQATTSHWYEIIRVNLEHENMYDVSWREKARLSRLEVSKRIGILSMKMRSQGLSQSELDELDRLHRGLGYLVVAKDDLEEVVRYVREREEESKGVEECI
ncbi:hypothetical protein B0T12DRAFT_484640 [Alternaria alternata]|nr:hypothetical protein B0T12DRAFT_484640 [Alternaria alternata]